MLIKNKKAGMSISIAILVILAAVLFASSLFYFMSRERNVSVTIFLGRAVEDVYFDEARISYQLREIFEDVTLEMSGPDEGVFVNSFNEGLRGSNLEVGEIVSEDVVVDGNKLTLEVDFVLTKNTEGIYIVYNHTKVLEKVFK
jgi:hypothetical protein